MSQHSALVDEAGFFRHIGLPQAGPQHERDANKATETFLTTLGVRNPHLALDIFARFWVTATVGEEILDEIPARDECTTEFLLQLIAAAWKKTPAKDREERLNAIMAESSSALVAALAVRTSLSPARTLEKSENQATEQHTAATTPPPTTEEPTATPPPPVTTHNPEQPPPPHTLKTNNQEQPTTTQPHTMTRSQVAKAQAAQEGQNQRLESPDPSIPTFNVGTAQLHQAISESISRALRERKALKKCGGCGFKKSGCICVRASPTRPVEDEQKAKPELKQDKFAQDAAGKDLEDKDSSDETSSEESDFSKAGCDADKSARKWARLSGATWADEAVILNPALWQIRLRQNPAQEWEFDRACDKRWLTPGRNGKIPGEALRRLALDNLKFFIRLAGPIPNPDTTRWAVRNLDELETSLFIENGASREEIDEFKRRLLGEDRPQRYKTAWNIKKGKKKY